MGKRAKHPKKKKSPQLINQSNQQTGQPKHNAAAGGGKDQDEKKIPAPDGKTEREEFFEYVGGGTFAVLSALFFGLDHKILGVVTAFISVAAFLARFATAISKKYSSKKTWLGYGAVVIVLALIAAVWANELRKPTELPTVSLEIGHNFDPKDPWGNSFVICNQGNQTICNVWADAYWDDPNVSQNVLFGLSALNG